MVTPPMRSVQCVYIRTRSIHFILLLKAQVWRGFLDLLS